VTSAIDEMYDESTSQSSDGKLFHTAGPETRLFMLVLTVTADLVVDDLSRLLAESESVKVTRHAGQPW